MLEYGVVPVILLSTSLDPLHLFCSRSGDARVRVKLRGAAYGQVQEGASLAVNQVSLLLRNALRELSTRPSPRLGELNGFVRKRFGVVMRTLLISLPRCAVSMRKRK
jgi:hypothetical protein